MAERPALLDSLTAYLARSNSWMATGVACAIFVPVMTYLHLRYFCSRIAAKIAPLARVAASTRVSPAGRRQQPRSIEYTKQIKTSTYDIIETSKIF